MQKIAIFFTLILFLLLLSFQLPTIAYQSGERNLDNTFGIGGKVITPFSSEFDAANAVAIQSDGKIIAAGQGGNSQTNDTDFALARYNQDGTLDGSFGTGGKVLFDVGGLGDIIESIALQPAGKIVAAGASFTANNFDFSLAQFNSNGTPDTSFGNGGKVITDFVGNEDRAFAMVLQPDGKIVVAGHTTDANQNLDFALVRYNATGTLDSTFGNGGKVILDFAGSVDQAFALVRQPDGKLIAGGLAINPATIQSNFALARFQTNGALDATFGSGGKVMTLVNDGSLIASLALLADGKLLAGGSTFTPNKGHQPNLPEHGTETQDFALARYNANGSLDSSFGEMGIVTTDFTGEDDEIGAITVQTDGRIIAVGGTVVGHRELTTAKWTILRKPFAPLDGDLDPTDFALARYDANGILDASFGLNGKVTTKLADDVNIAFSVALQTDGRIVAAGRAGTNRNADFALARYTPTGFDYCIQDEARGNILRFNSVTGEYDFINCYKNITLTGRGAITANGCKIDLMDTGINPKKPDRNVTVSVNSCTRNGSASIFVFASGYRTILGDADFTNNSCLCR